MKNNEKMFGIKSIRTKLILIMIGMLGFTLAAIWFMNRIFLPAYYQTAKCRCWRDAMIMQTLS